MGSCLAQICVIDTNQGLTMHELKAIVGVMNWRVDRSCTKKYHIHPVSEPTSFVCPSHS